MMRRNVLCQVTLNKLTKTHFKRLADKHLFWLCFQPHCASLDCSLFLNSRANSLLLINLGNQKSGLLSRHIKKLEKFMKLAVISYWASMLLRPLLDQKANFEIQHSYSLGTWASREVNKLRCLKSHEINSYSSLNNKDTFWSGNF